MRGLAPLKTLRHLKVHLDFPVSMMPSEGPAWWLGPDYFAYEKYENKVVRPVAAAFASAIGPSLATVSLTSVAVEGACWSNYSTEAGVLTGRVERVLRLQNPVPKC